MSDGHTQAQIDAGFKTIRLLVELALASGVSGTCDDVVRGATARILTLEAELARKAIQDKKVAQARTHLLAALGRHAPGQCPGVGCGCECLCVEELAGMVAKELAEYKEAVMVLAKIAVSLDEHIGALRIAIKATQASVEWPLLQAAMLRTNRLASLNPHDDCPIAKAAIEGSKA